MSSIVGRVFLKVNEIGRIGGNLLSCMLDLYTVNRERGAQIPYGIRFSGNRRYFATLRRRHRRIHSRAQVVEVAWRDGKK